MLRSLPDLLLQLHLHIHLRLFCSVRPLGVLFLGLFSYWLYWTRCSYRVVLTPELREKFESWLRRADNWRHNSPSMFCLVSTGCLATFAVLGHLLSGSVLVMTLLVVSAVVSTKYNFKLVHIERRGKFSLQFGPLLPILINSICRFPMVGADQLL